MTASRAGSVPAAARRGAAGRAASPPGAAEPGAALGQALEVDDARPARSPGPPASASTPAAPARGCAADRSRSAFAATRASSSIAAETSRSGASAPSSSPTRCRSSIRSPARRSAASAGHRRGRHVGSERTRLARRHGRYAHHLLDPATGRPAWTGLVGVTALASRRGGGRDAVQGSASCRAVGCRAGDLAEPGGVRPRQRRRREGQPTRGQPPACYPTCSRLHEPRDLHHSPDTWLLADQPRIRHAWRLGLVTVCGAARADDSRQAAAPSGDPTYAACDSTSTSPSWPWSRSPCTA